MNSLNELKEKIAELENLKQEDRLYLYPSGMLQAYEEVLPLVERLSKPSLDLQSILPDEEIDRLFNDLGGTIKNITTMRAMAKITRDIIQKRIK